MKKGHSAGRALWITPHRDSIKIYNINCDLSSGKSVNKFCVFVEILPANLNWRGLATFCGGRP